MGLKEEVYAAIRAEFDRDPEDSFLVQYLRQEKERLTEAVLTRRARKKPDACTRLLLCRKALSAGDDPAGRGQCLGALAELLAQNPRLTPGKTALEILERAAGAEPVSGGSRLNRQRYEQMLSVLRSGRCRCAAEELDTVLRDVTTRFLIREGKAMLYDAIDAGRGEPDGPAAGRKPKVDRMLDVFCAYLQRQGVDSLEQAAADAGASAGEDLTEDWQTLYALLNRRDLQPAARRDAMRVRLPVRVDEKTGAALWLVGRQSIAGDRRLREKLDGRNCCWMGFYADDLTVENGEDGGEISLRWLEEDTPPEAMLYPHGEEALAWYERVLRPEAMRLCREANGKAPDGCPESLKDRFREN